MQSNSLRQLQQCTVPIKRSSYQSIECKYSLCAVSQCGTTGMVRCNVQCHSLARCEIPCRVPCRATSTSAAGLRADLPVLHVSRCRRWPRRRLVDVSTSVDRASKWLECSSGFQVAKHCCDAAYKAAKCRLLGDAMPCGVTWHGIASPGSNVAS